MANVTDRSSIDKSFAGIEVSKPFGSAQGAAINLNTNNQDYYIYCSGDELRFGSNPGTSASSAMLIKSDGDIVFSEQLTGPSFNGNLVGDVTGSLIGNAATSSKLKDAVNVGGVSFDGTSSIVLPGVNISGNQDTTGNAATATILASSRNIGGVSFNGSSNINLPGVNITGNQDTTGNAATASTATTLQTARNIGGVSFDGSSDIVPDTITVSDTTDTLAYVGLWESSTGDISPKTDEKLTYNASTGNLTATSFTGAFTGTLTGQVDDISNFTTTDLAEGDNLYYTDAAAQAAITVENITTGPTGIGKVGGNITYNHHTTTARTGSDNFGSFSSAGKDGEVIQDISYTDEGHISSVHTADLDDRYHPIGGSSTTDLIVNDLTLTGTATTVDSTTINIGTNVLTLATDLSNTTNPSLDAGITINRGAEADAHLYFDETINNWRLWWGGDKTNTGTLYANIAGNVIGNADSATVATTANTLTNAVTIGGVSFDGSTNIVPNTINVNGTPGNTALYPWMSTKTSAGLEALTPVTDGQFYFYPSSNNLYLGSSNAVGTLVGNVTGNVTGTVLTGSQSSITSMVNLTTVGTISTGSWEGSPITSTYIADDSITGDKIADNAIGSEHYIDGSINFTSLKPNIIQLSSETFTDNDTTLMTSAAIEDRIKGHTDADTVDGKHAADFLPITGGSLTGNLWTHLLTLRNSGSTHLTEGGELALEAAQNSKIGADIHTCNIDVVSHTGGDRLRVFSYRKESETAATQHRGAYININECDPGIGTRLWHSSNDGPESGLDADQLDGQHGSYYLDWNNMSSTDRPGVTIGNKTVTLGGTITSNEIISSFDTNSISNKKVNLNISNTDNGICKLTQTTTTSSGKLELTSPTSSEIEGWFTSNVLNTEAEEPHGAVIITKSGGGSPGVNIELPQSVDTNATPRFENITAKEFYTTSDVSLKENIKDIDNGLDTVLGLSGVSYNWKSGNTTKLGLIANDVEEVVPEAVITSDSGLKAIDYVGIISNLVEAVKTLNKKIDTLEEKS